MALIQIRFLNDKIVSLTVGEVNAIERMARMNGTDPEKIQYDPGHVRWTTLNNLVRKGVLRRDGRRLEYFVEGLLEVEGPTLYRFKKFSLDPYRVVSEES